MTDNWDFYFLRVDDQPASIFVDLGALEFAPVATLPFMAYIRLDMLMPREDGLSSQEEYDQLATIEDSLLRLVDAQTAYVGRCTTAGCRDFFFYLADGENWSQRVSAIMQAFPDYHFEAASHEEPDWAAYLEYLYPSEADRQTIENRRVCEALQRQGDALDTEREIDHWAYFEDAASRDAYVDDAIQLGYTVRQLIDAEGDHQRFGAQMWRRDTPSLHDIDDITLPLFNLANLYEGEYDGWETQVVKAA